MFYGTIQSHGELMLKCRAYFLEKKFGSDTLIAQGTHYL